ncbi:probable ATP-dependent RNA helicase DDX31 [Vanessa atalanta]|uniref:probable ATP-dependent RNA helicase DDX31 n=1 Tax=Vanessa atalanta TaxID=42275 RepID=UPI001FCCFF33|nr:probable ATP-dependent RNA helicase DDX31 [Vanessa atalanta]
MDDLQLNITSTIKNQNKTKKQTIQKNANEYKFKSKPDFSGKIIAFKRPQNAGQKNFSQKNSNEPPNKVPKLSNIAPSKPEDLQLRLRELSENKGKFHGKNYQDLSDDLQTKQKPRNGPWISSLFKNNPEVPKMGQKAVKPLVEKVFAGKTFADLNIHPHSVANLKQNLNLSEMMTVQQKSISIILQGRDVLIRSQTGSGKTLAYALPIVEGLQAIRPKINRNDGVKVIVVVPTRELAVQTYELFVKLTKPFIWIVPGLLSGGQKRKAEKARLRKGLSILVGTPGRINDHLLHTHSLNFAKTGCLVLDEADRLLDMGYEKDVAAIVKAIEDHKKAATYDPMALVKQNIKKPLENDEQQDIPNGDDKPVEHNVEHALTKIFQSTERQTILLSATLTKAVENLAGITMQDPVFVDTSDGKALVADSLKETSKHTDLKKSDISSENIKMSEKNIVPKVITEELNAKPDDIEEKQESRTGLKAFNGSNHPELFAGVKNKGQTNNSTVSVSGKKDDESDSDSDYEYFKVQKELEVKDPKVDKLDEAKTKHEKVEEPVANTFVEALKTAITEDELILPATVNQTFLIVPMKLRLVTLCALIVEHCVINRKGGKMIVFMATLEMVDYLSELIETVLTGKEDKAKKKNESEKKNSKANKRKTKDEDSDSEYEMDYEAPAEGGIVPHDLDVFSLHGSMPHENRIEVFKQFRVAKRGLLICTDVAARGLDVPRVDLVLQFCAPASATDYVHRVGRTGRAEQVGAAILFLLPSESEFVRHLEQKRIRLRQSDEMKALSVLQNIVPTAPTPQRAAIAVQARLEHTAHSSRDWLARASRAYTSWVRFYSTYPREVRMWLDARQLHLGHAAKAFALRETPGALARRAKSDPNVRKERPNNRLTIHDEDEKKRPGFPKVKPGIFGKRIVNKQSSMHTASEFDSGLPPVDTYSNKKRKNK